MSERESTACWPSVGVVVPTKDRPALLGQALAAILAQDYPGEVLVVVVDDAGAQYPDVAQGDRPGTPRRSTSVVTNSRTPGLAGARNTGIAGLSTDLVAFCDDDDVWAPDKLTAQVAALLSEPEAEMAACAIEVDYAGVRSVRRAGRERLEYADLLGSRMSMAHSSTFLLRRDRLMDGIGLLDETIPGSQNEDWDLLLRAARRHPVVMVDEPLVRVLWGQSSYFSRQWQTRVSSLLWMLRRHPEIAGHRIGAARVYGQLAFGYAVLGQRRTSLRWSARSVRRRWREPRGLIAAAVATRLVPAERVMATLHRRGHGI